MKQYPPDKIRNLAFVGHQHTGKTLLAEAILLDTGVLGRMGKIEDGNTVMDSAPEEIERQLTIQTALAGCEFNGHKVNILDTPGYEDFVGEVVSALDVADAALLTARADGGAEVGTDKTWERIKEKNLPAVVVITKMDKEHASFETCLESLRSHFGSHIIPAQVPIGEGPSFKGVVDLITGKAYEYAGGKAKETGIPEDIAGKVDGWRKELFESAAENDEELMEKYLETDMLTPDEVVRGLAAAVAGGELHPVYCTSSELNVGIAHLLQGIVDVVPSPVDRPLEIEGGKVEADASKPAAAKVFKNVSESHVGDMLFLRVYRGKLAGGNDIFNSTRGASDRLGQLFYLQGKTRVDTPSIGAGDLGAAVKLKNAHVGDTLCDKAAPVKIPPADFPRPSIFSAISAASKGDEDKIGTGLNRLKEEDPTFEVRVDSEIRQTLISGQGELHLDVVIGRLKSRFGVEVILSKPRIAYKETIRKKAEAQGKYKKQTGGRGQYGDVWLKLEPMGRGEKFEFVDAVVGGVVPGKFIPAVEKGVVGAMTDGVLAGYPVVDVRVTLYDGSYHSVDSSEQAFKVAGSMAFKKAAEKAGLVLLEPIMNVEVKIPEEFMGDVMGDLSGRRGKIQGMDTQGHFTVIRAQVPQADLYRYSTHLRSITQGRGTHKREFSHYEDVPHDQTLKVIEEAKKEKQEAA